MPPGTPPTEEGELVGATPAHAKVRSDPQSSSRRSSVEAAEPISRQLVF